MIIFHILITYLPSINFQRRSHYKRLNLFQRKTSCVLAVSIFVHHTSCCFFKSVGKIEVIFDRHACFLKRTLLLAVSETF